MFTDIVKACMLMDVTFEWILKENAIYSPRVERVLACVCGSEEGLTLCPGCNAIYYCGETCQRADRARHALDCRVPP
jgi:hypothetical protein